MNQSFSKPTRSLAESAPIEHITLDCDNILTHAGGDPELLIHLCCAFLNELPIRMDSLQSAMQHPNKRGIERALQQLRNCLIVFGSGQICSTAEMLGVAIRSDKSQQMKREWKRLQGQLHYLVPQVQRLMLEMSDPGPGVQ
jgi:hypothetical protein